MSAPWRVTFTINVSGQIEIHPPSPGGDTIRGVITFTTEREAHMGEITVDASEAHLSATVTFQDAEGNPTTPDETPVWEVGDESVLACTPTDDGMGATFVVGAPGVSSVSVSTVETHGGEGDPTPILLTGLVTVTAGDTVTGSVDFTTAYVAPLE
jgi:hypothetical protein